jgi:hypothetical protein
MAALPKISDLVVITLGVHLVFPFLSGAKCRKTTDP